MRNNMTPLEKAEQKQKFPRCAECAKAKRIGRILYCTVDGKIILPRFYNECLCRGERLKWVQT